MCNGCSTCGCVFEKIIYVYMLHFFMKKLSVLFLSFILLSSCHNNESPVSKKYFEIDIDPSYATDQTDNWIMLHDQNGVLLDARQYESGDNLTFETAQQILNNKIAVTQLVISSNPSNFSFQTFLCEDTQATWTLRGQNIDNGSIVGSLDVSVTDPQIGSAYDSYMSTRFNSNSLPDFSDPNTLIFPSATITATNNNFFICIYDKNNVPKYKFLQNAMPGQFTYSLNDFNSFDNILTVNLPSTTYYNRLLVLGYENYVDLKNSQGYTVDFSESDIANYATHGTFNIGFLNRFYKYKTFISSYNYTDNYTLQYESVGAEPTSITLPASSSFNATVKDKSFTTYAVSSVDYTWRSTSWGYYGNFNGVDTNISWEVIASADYFKNPGEIPKAILNQYPFLKQDLLYISSTFYKINKPWSYVLSTYSDAGDFSEDYIQTSKISY